MTGVFLRKIGRPTNEPVRRGGNLAEATLAGSGCGTVRGGVTAGGFAGSGNPEIGAGSLLAGAAGGSLIITGGATGGGTAGGTVIAAGGGGADGDSTI